MTTPQVSLAPGKSALEARPATGIIPTGVSTTGAIPSGVARPATGLIPTGVSATGVILTGVSATGVISTGVSATGGIPTGVTATGVMLTGVPGPNTGRRPAVNTLNVPGVQNITGDQLLGLNSGTIIMDGQNLIVVPQMPREYYLFM